MKIAVYTSCALNYYAKARALAESIRRNSPNTSLTLCLCDLLEDGCDPLTQGFDRHWSLDDLGYDAGWIFKHNVMELCTGVKGRALKRLMQEEDADLYVYLDPDVYVYNDLAVVAEYMNGASIGLVPHILTTEETDIGVQLTEMSVTEHGIYNLGHLFVRPDDNGRALADWWAERLDKYCYDDKTIGLFTDQRWMDLAPAVFEGVKILRVPNLDVASWNIAGRRIEQATAGDERSFRVDNYPLVTYHFSGTGPTGTHRRIREIFDPDNGAVAELERRYEEAIGRHGQQRLEKIPPAFDLFQNGATIPAEARKTYRVHDDIQSAFPDPFSTNGIYNYLDWLREHRPGLAKGLIVPEAWRARAFDDLFDAHFYVDRYPDAAAAVKREDFETALDHYIHVGSALLYDPSEFFVSRYYFEKAKYLDGFKFRALPRSRQTTVLWHYLEVGLRHGIEPIEYFDSNFYLKQYSDVRSGFTSGMISTPLAHFYSFGSSENRRPGPSFDPMALLDREPGLAATIEQDKLRGAFGALVRRGRVLGRGTVEL